MLYAASEAVAASLTEEDRAEGRVFPRVARIRQVSLKVATEVAKVSASFYFSILFFSRFLLSFPILKKRNKPNSPPSFLPPSLALSLQAAVMEKLARNVGVADLPYLEGIIQRKMYDPTYVPLVAPN